MKESAQRSSSLKHSECHSLCPVPGPCSDSVCLVFFPSCLFVHVLSWFLSSLYCLSFCWVCVDVCSVSCLHISLSLFILHSPGHAPTTSQLSLVTCTCALSHSLPSVSHLLLGCMLCLACLQSWFVRFVWCPVVSSCLSLIWFSVLYVSYMFMWVFS